jgi:hypothetical protein
MDETLGSLFRQEQFRAALGEDHLFFVEYVLANPELGPNLRNELAHGNADPLELQAHRVLLLWLFVIRLTFYGPTRVEQQPRTPTQEDIALAAYYRWEEGGRVQGHDFEDWFAAERDLRL